MGVKPDKWIKEQAKKGMIEPFAESQVSQGMISFGISSYGYDMRIAEEFKIFTNVYSEIVDPKNFSVKSFVDYKGLECIIPPNSFALARSLEYFRIPRDIICIVLGKSTYARMGIIVNVTPLEPCYDKETEILTVEGWKRFEDLKDNETVATLNPKTYKLEYQKILAKQKFKFTGNMVHIGGRQIDLLVTPAHQIYAKNRYDGNYRFRRADEIYGKYNYELKRDCIWHGKRKEYFKLPPVKIDRKYDREEKVVNKIIKILKEKDLTTKEIFREVKTLASYENLRHTLKVLQEDGAIAKEAIYLARRIGASKHNLWKLVKPDYKFDKAYIESISIKIDDWLRFFGFWLAEGSAYKSDTKKNYTVKLAIFDPKVKDTVEDWLRKLPFNYRRIDSGLEILDKQLCMYLLQFGHAREKYIPGYVKELPPEQIQIFLESFMLGDGNLQTQTFSTSSKKLADGLQELILKAGWASIIRDVQLRPHRLRGKEIKPNGPGYKVRISKNHLTPKIYPRSFSTTFYDDYVYDVTVLNHTLYVRRNGKACWSSNCWEGFVTIEISNTTPLPVKVYANEGIAQVLFLSADEECEVSYADKKGKYQKQTGIWLPKIK
jgi:deoxycytidine triphosphate deaminase